MCGDYTNRDFLKKEWEQAQEKIADYHIHIYFRPDAAGQAPRFEEYFAHRIADRMRKLFPGDVKGTYNVGTVGPHALPNVEIDIKRESFGRILQWLQMNNEGLSILVHPETGDDLKDHLENSLWINRESSYDEAFFERLRAGRKDAPVRKGKFTPKP